MLWISLSESIDKNKHKSKFIQNIYTYVRLGTFCIFYSLKYNTYSFGQLNMFAINRIYLLVDWLSPWSLKYNTFIFGQLKMFAMNRIYLFVDWLSPWSLFLLNVALYQFLPLSRGQGRFNLNNDRIFQLLFSSTGYFRKLYLSLQVRVLWNILKYLSIDSYFEISSGTLLRIKL